MRFRWLCNVIQDGGFGSPQYRDTRNVCIHFHTEEKFNGLIYTLCTISPLHEANIVEKYTNKQSYFAICGNIYMWIPPIYLIHTVFDFSDTCRIAPMIAE